MENYKFVGDVNEIKWFFDHIVEKPEINESYLMCISSRAKKVSPEERVRIQLGRGEMMREQVLVPRGKEQLWTFENFLSYFYRYECPYLGMVTKSGDPYPQNSLVLYFYVNPSDEHKVAMDSMTFTNGILNDLINACTSNSKDGIREQLFKLRKLDVHKKTCRATNINRHLWNQFDFDFSDDVKLDIVKIDKVKNTLREVGNQLFGKGHIVIVRTSGGFHILAHREGMKYWGTVVRKSDDKYKDPIQAYLKIVDDVLGMSDSIKWHEEWVKTDQSFLPCPGTIQYGNFVVSVENKEDFC